VNTNHEYSGEFDVRSFLPDRHKYPILNGQFVRYSRIITDSESFHTSVAWLLLALYLKGYDFPTLWRRAQHLIRKDIVRHPAWHSAWVRLLAIRIHLMFLVFQVPPGAFFVPLVRFLHS